MEDGRAGLRSLGPFSRTSKVHGEVGLAGIVREESMKNMYDQEVDAFSIVFSDTTVTTAELAEGIAAESAG
jgi:hypothetical protein